MADSTYWTQSLPQDTQSTLASYGATAHVDVMAVLRREKLLRKAVSYLSWDDVVAAGVGLQNNSFGMEPEVAIDLMRRPEAGLLFVGGFFTDLGIPSILRHPELANIEEYKRRIDVTRVLVHAINAGEVVETSWKFVAQAWLLTRARDRLAEFGPGWALNPAIVNPVIAQAERKLQNRVHVKADNLKSADLIDYAAHRDNKARGSAPTQSKIGRLMQSFGTKTSL